MRIGILAPEFPPQVGGMEEYARAIAIALSGLADVTVFTRPRCGIADAPFGQVPLQWPDLGAVARALSRHTVDAWYAINCALAAMAPRLAQPLFVSCNGNDFLSPWIGYARPWDRLVRRSPNLKRRLAPLIWEDRRRQIQRGLPSVRGVFAISRAAAEVFDRTYPGFADRTTVVLCGVDDDFLNAPLPDPRRNGPLRLLTVARLSSTADRKNVDGVLRAVALVRNRLPVHYTVVGDGNRRPELMALAQALGVGDRVTFRGQVTRAELIHAYGHADLFILAAKASDYDVEGFGIVYLEANACGVPVVCSRAGGAIDAVEDGRSGIIIDDSTPETIASAIVGFAESRDRFRPADLRAFAERYRWPAIARTIHARIVEGLSMAP